MCRGPRTRLATRQPVCCRDEQKGGPRAVDEVGQVLFGLEGFDVVGAEVVDLDGELARCR